VSTGSLVPLSDSSGERDRRCEAGRGGRPL